jgi:methionyl-tRNA synthetase
MQRERLPRPAPRKSKGLVIENASLEDFKKISLKTAIVKEVKEHPNADRLWIVTLDAGGDSTLEIVAGIRPAYPKEDLIGKTIIYVSNLKPATIRGVESKGMLLVVKNGEKPSILTTDQAVPPGSAVS